MKYLQKEKSIEVKNLVKQFDRKVVLNGISFEVNKGEIYGFLGPNGAGKTTLVKILNGLIKPDEGYVEVFGISPVKYPDKVHAKIGTLTETANMYKYLTGLENLIFFSKIFGMNDMQAKERSLEVLKMIDMYDEKDKKLEFYSTGMKKRLSLARTFLHSPKIVILDEPTTGLDPESAKNINTAIKRYTEENEATVFLCTHQLRYAQDICTKYAFINNGNIICIGELCDIIKKYKFDKYIYIEAEINHNLEEFNLTRLNGNEYRAIMKDKEQVSKIVERIVLNGGKVYSVRILEPSLEDVYFKLIKRGGAYEQFS